MNATNMKIAVKTGTETPFKGNLAYGTDQGCPKIHAEAWLPHARHSLQPEQR
jgi:hypothetical protein